MTEVVKSGCLYFAAVFGAGFLLGAIRVLFIVPRLGVRTAELIEMPIMGVVIILAARWVARRTKAPTPRRLLAVGAIGLGLLVTAELSMVLFVSRVTIGEYLSGRDPVSGAAFLLMLGLFAIMPAIAGSRLRVDSARAG